MTTKHKNRAESHPVLSVLGSGGTGGPPAYIGVVIFLFVWTLVSTLGIVNALLLPSPMRVLGSVQDVGIVLIYHLSATILRVAIGYLIGTVLGVVTGVLMQSDRRFYRSLDGLIETFRPVPPVAMIPFFILLFGFSELGKILITVLGVWLLITVTVVESIERVSPNIIRLGLVVGLSRRDLFRMVVVPAAWPEMRTGFRLAMALAISLVIVSEFMGATYGMGYLISVSKVTLTTSTMLLCIIILGWTGWFFDLILRIIFDKTTKWDIRAKGAIR